MIRLPLSKDVTISGDTKISALHRNHYEIQPAGILGAFNAGAFAKFIPREGLTFADAAILTACEEMLDRVMVDEVENGTVTARVAAIAESLKPTTFPEEP